MSSKNKRYMPLVSIITPILNNAKYVRRCIQGTLNQTYPNVEHIFIDGGSTDGTVAILAEYHKKYPERIRFISEVDECRDIAGNKGVNMARGEIFGNLGSDDIYEPDTAQVIVDFFRENPNAYFVYGTGSYVDENGMVIGLIPTRDFTLKSFVNGHMYVNMTSAFYKREVFEKVGLFYVDPEAINVCDTDFVIRAGRVFKIYRIDKVLSKFRMHHWEFSGEAWERQKQQLRSKYLICRKNGANIFSWSARIYFMSLLIDWLRPVFGFAYPIIEKIVDKYRFSKRDNERLA
jgi:glycosyltransferase involved in cell wall biosynthesis